MNWVANLYNRLPQDNAALALKSKVGIAANTGGFTAGIQKLAEGDIWGGLLRLAAPSFSSSGEAIAHWTAKVNEELKLPGPYQSKQNYGWWRELALHHPMGFNYGPKIIGSASLFSAGCILDDKSYMLSGGLYTITNSMKGFGARNMIVTSTILSGTAGASILGNGIYQGNGGDIVGGTLSIALAVILSRVNPNNLSSQNCRT